MPKPKIATKMDTLGLNQQIRISTVLIIANIIQSREPALSFLQCKMQAVDQLLVAVDEDWQA